MYIVIAVSGKNTNLSRTLNSLLECKLPLTFNGIYIVENGHKHDTEEVCLAYNEKLIINYIYTDYANKSNALNLAVRNIPDQELIFFTDDDARFHPNVLIEYEECSKKYEKGIFMGGPVLPDFESRPREWLLPFYPKSVKGWNPSMSAVSFDNNDFFFGINYAVYAKDIKNAGYFNTRYGPGTKPKRTGQETELQQRLFKAGLKPIYVQKAVVWHYVPKEKATVRWAVSRRFQLGITRGMEMKHLSIYQFLIYNSLELMKYFFLVLCDIVLLKRNKLLLDTANLITTTGKYKGYQLKIPGI